MVSLELLRQFPHFSGVSEDCLKQIAMISHSRSFKSGEYLIKEGHRASNFYLLLSGTVDVVYRLGDDREVVADSLTRGDAFGWSALIEPHLLTASCRGNKDGELVEIAADGLREVCDENLACGYMIIKEVSKTLRDRLSSLRVQIAASR